MDLTRQNFGIKQYLLSSRGRYTTEPIGSHSVVHCRETATPSSVKWVPLCMCVEYVTHSICAKHKINVDIKMAGEELVFCIVCASQTHHLVILGIETKNWAENQKSRYAECAHRTNTTISQSCTSDLMFSPGISLASCSQQQPHCTYYY